MSGGLWCHLGRVGVGVCGSWMIFAQTLSQAPDADWRLDPIWNPRTPNPNPNRNPTFGAVFGAKRSAINDLESGLSGGCQKQYTRGLSSPATRSSSCVEAFRKGLSARWPRLWSPGLNNRNSPAIYPPQPILLLPIPSLDSKSHNDSHDSISFSHTRTKAANKGKSGKSEAIAKIAAIKYVMENWAHTADRRDATGQRLLAHFDLFISMPHELQWSVLKWD